MRLIKSVAEMQKWAVKNGRDCGIVPTLGSLHEGHASLIKKARSENGLVVVSVFVNPLQFKRDKFLAYPRNLREDMALAKKAGADVLFAPSADDMYKNDFESQIVLPKMFKTLAHQGLEWHYRGVLAVVMKLFQIILPARAYFGLKDPHQLALIERMVADLNVPVKIRRCETIREKSGLARSSRNALLTAEERKAATVIYKSLELAKARLRKNGHGNLRGVMSEMKKLIHAEKTARVEHIEIVDPASFLPFDKKSKEALVFTAVNVGGKRLTDNLRFTLPVSPRN
ncbi:MAG: pantoate--beta-alanine ligase [Nitrospinae bacterium]|nr:pantoate--beta-alanine ligase [Nitrospinota bacterium]